MKHTFVAALALLAASSQPRAQEAAPRTRFHWADANGDGLQDAFVVRPGGAGRLLLADGAGGFQDQSELLAGADLGPLEAVAWGDVEGDGRPELLVVQTDGRARLLVCDAGGGYADLTGLAGLPRLDDAVAAEWIDFDADGKADVLLQTATAERLFRGDGRGLFEPVLLGLAPMLPPAADTRASVADQTAASTESTRRLEVPGAVAAPGRSVAGDSSRTPESGIGRLDAPDVRSAGSASGPGGSSAAPTAVGSPRGNAGLLLPAASAIRDQATGDRLLASSLPTSGMLFPLGVDLFVDPASRNVGLGTLTPQTKLQVSGGTDAAPAGGGFLQLGEASGSNVALDSNEIMARSNGSAATLSLNADGGNVLFGSSSTGSRVGVGTAAPEARLHVLDGSAGSVTANSNSIAVFERSSGGWLSILGPDGFSKGILFGNTTSNASGGLVYDQASVGSEGLQFRTGGNATRMTITQAGDVGIGTSFPAGKLHVAGSSGDGSVVLPADAIGTAELFGEMGIASDLIPSSTLVNGIKTGLSLRSITVPSSGYVLAIGTSQPQNLNPFLGETIDFEIEWLQTGKKTPAFSQLLAAGVDVSTCTIQGLFSVGAGTHTFSLSASTFTGLDIFAYFSRLTLLFVPTTYGTTDVDD